MAEDAKSMLRKIKLYDACINSKIEELERLKDMVTHITTAFGSEPVVGCGNGDKIGNTVAKIVDLQNEINQEIDNFVDLKRQVNKILGFMENPYQMQVLHKRYFRYEKWEQIACDMGYSYQGVLKLHGRGLQAFEKILKKQKCIQK